MGNRSLLFDQSDCSIHKCRALNGTIIYGIYQPQKKKYPPPSPQCNTHSQNDTTHDRTRAGLQVPSLENWGGGLKSLLRLANSPNNGKIHTKYYCRLRSSNDDDTIFSNAQFRHLHKWTFLSTTPYLTQSHTLLNANSQTYSHTYTVTQSRTVTHTLTHTLSRTVTHTHTHSLTHTHHH